MSRTRGDAWRLAVASAASNTGNWAATVALSLVVYAKTGSTVWLAADLNQGPLLADGNLANALAEARPPRG